MSSNPSDKVERIVRQHQSWRTKDCLNMQAAENRGSSQMRNMFLADLGNRYNDPEKFHKGAKYADELVSMTEELARKVFNARYADVRALSGHMTDTAVLLALTKRGDAIVSVNPDDGGYPGVTSMGLGGVLGLRNVFFPYDPQMVNIDVRESGRVLKAERPTVAFMGSSFIPFPHPLKQLTPLVDGVSVYDGSHVLGLIAGGEFQDPLREGCSLLVGSTHKSFPGPQGGIILSNNEEVFSSVTAMMYYILVDNIHLDRVAALAIALAEMQQFGKAYAQATVKNSQTLAKALVSEGVRVRGQASGYSKSHQVLMDYDSAKLKFFATRLEQSNIMVDDGGRLGTSEATRMGFGPSEMEAVAELVAMVVLGKKPADFVQKKVKSLVKDFQEPRFVLKKAPEPFA